VASAGSKSQRLVDPSLILGKDGVLGNRPIVGDPPSSLSPSDGLFFFPLFRPCIEVDFMRPGRHRG